MHYCANVDGDKPAGDWTTSHDSVHGVLVNKKSNAMLVFILFPPKKTLCPSWETGRLVEGGSITFLPGVRQAPEGGRERRKMENTGSEVICGAPTTPASTGKVKVIVKLLSNNSRRLVLPQPTHCCQ